MCVPEKKSSDAGSFVGALLVSAAIGAAKAAWWLLEHLVAVLIIAIVWATPRAYRLARRGVRGARRWYLMRPVVLDRQPVAAVTATTDLPTLADLRLKEPANS